MAIGTQLLNHPVTLEPGYPWDDHVPPPAQDATLLAVVPIPGTRTSLAIVGYAISTSDEPEPRPAPGQPDQPATSSARRPRDGAAAPGGITRMAHWLYEQSVLRGR